jgi:hypothetical protein
MKEDLVLDDVHSCKTPSMSTAPYTNIDLASNPSSEPENFNNHLNKDHKLEYVYTWFKENRDKFKPALDVLPQSFLDSNGIDSTMEVMVVDARDPEFDTQILYT